MRRSLQIDEQCYGKDTASRPDPEDLGQLLMATNRRPEAETRICRSLEIVEQSYGDSHP